MTGVVSLGVPWPVGRRGGEVVLERVIGGGSIPEEGEGRGRKAMGWGVGRGGRSTESEGGLSGGLCGVGVVGVVGIVDVTGIVDVVGVVGVWMSVNRLGRGRGCGIGAHGDCGGVDGRASWSGGGGGRVVVRDVVWGGDVVGEGLRLLWRHRAR
jgi:hypothetical protein